MIEAKMMEMVRKNEPVVRKEISKAEALEMFRKDGQTFKCEHIDLDLEDGSITTYTQGSFTDLCRGPHLMSTGSIKALKNISSSGCFIGCFSYWNIEEQSSGFRMKDYIVGENRNDPASVILEVNPSYVKDELIVPNEEGEGFYKLGKPKSDLVFTDSNSRRISTAHFGHDYILNFSVGGEFKLEIDYYVEGEDDLRQIFKKGFCCK